jgi:hypothetical protein
MQICIGNLYNLYSYGSYIATPARCQRASLSEIRVLLPRTRAMRRIFAIYPFRENEYVITFRANRELARTEPRQGIESFDRLRYAFGTTENGQ